MRKGVFFLQGLAMAKSIPFTKLQPIVQLVLAVNFTAALIFMVLVSFMTFLGHSVLFEDHSDLYGPMDSNLRLMMLYLCLTEIAVCSFCHFSKQYQGVLLMGCFLLVLAVSVDFYGEINQVPIDEHYRWFFAYLGLSHVAYASTFKTRNQSLA